MPTTPDLELTEGEEWVERISPNARLCAFVWECGDDCGCWQAQIFEFTSNAYTDLAFGPVHWHGTYNIEFGGNPTRELNRIARHLRRHHHDLYVRIEWPWDRSRARGGNDGT